MSKTTFCDIILPLPLQQLFTYSIPEELISKAVPGVRIVVQFGRKKIYSGVIRFIHQNKPAAYQTKPIISILDDHPIIDNSQFLFWEWIAGYYMCSLGEVYKAALPSGLKLESETKIIYNPDLDLDQNFKKNEETILSILEKERNITISKLAAIVDNKNILNTISSLVEKKALFLEERLKESYRPLKEDFIILDNAYSSQDSINQLFEQIKRAPKQTQLLLAYLSLNDLDKKLVEIRKKEVLEKANVSSQVLKQLVEKEIFQITKKEKSRIDNQETDSVNSVKELNSFQKTAIKLVYEQHQEKDVVLLHGITSSGKTEIYIHYIQKIIEQGKQVLYLLPEIALTTQIINRLKHVFGDKVGIYHSKFNDSERVEIWQNVQKNDDKSYQVILGVRSSLYLPFRNLGLIIVDEEHENTYKQFDPAPRYNARDGAIVLANLHKSKVLLGTATPSLESFYNAKSGKYGFVNLDKRYKEIQLPEIIVANTKEAYRKKQMQGHFTPRLIDHIQEALENKEQIILFQNRRGFSPYLECELCSTVPYCNYCDVSLTYHKHNNSLVCHYCGFTEKNTGICGACGNPSLITKGFGTEKIEDEISIFFPDAKVSRLDLDTTRLKNAYQQILGDFENRKIDILVGTQMISKGLDFENVSIVGILNADNMLNFPDFRAFERSYQLMAQVSGRSGRSSKRGKVIIQTSDPKHKIIKFLIDNNFEGMFNSQIKERQKFKYPPFYRLIEITLKHKKVNVCNHAANILSDQLKNTFGARILGPHTPIISKIQNYFLQKVVIKIESDKSQKKAKEIVNHKIIHLLTQDKFKSLLISINVDPQ